MIYSKKIRLFVMLLAGWAMASAVAASAKSPVVTAITFREADGKTILDAEISRPTAFTVTASATPARIIVDFGGVDFNLGPSPVFTQGLVKAWRSAIVDGQHGRLMVETTAPANIISSKLVPGLGHKPAHIVIELARAASLAPPAPAPAPANSALAPGDPLITGSLAPQAPLAIPQKVIVIDPGHGGGDPGARAADGLAEKDVVLAFAKTLKSALEGTGHYKVVLTRESDAFLPLEQRVKLAREANADLFLVIHADMLTGPLLQRNQVRGMTLYTVSDKASDAEAEALAQKENRADIIAGVDLGGKSTEVSNVLINLAQRESRAQALKFAAKALAEARSVTSVTSQPMRSAAFVVLKAPDVASVLVELGYLSNPLDEAQLQSEGWRAKMAAALTRAVDGYFAWPAMVSGK